MDAYTFAIQPLACDPARLKGLSPRLIQSHYDNNYSGAVKRLNAIGAQLAALDCSAVPGFVINVAFLPRDQRLVNQWAADHMHALAGAVPILALDMYEHSYHLDYGAKAGEYVDAFMQNIAWPAVSNRLEAVA